MNSPASFAAEKITADAFALEIGATRALFDALRTRALAPLSTRTPREFAESVMRMPDAHGATRPFSFDFAPYQREPFEEIFNPRNHEVVMMMASRLGKSRIVLTALGFIIVEQPCRIGVMWPVEGDGKLWSKDDFMGELVEPTPEIAALIADSRGQRKSAQTILHKQFTGGLLQILGANAPGRMRRMKARFLYADEIDAIIDISSDEGDQLAIFKKRGAEYPDTIEVYCSYPSLKGRSRIEAKLLESDYRQWFVTCAICGGEEYVMRRDQLRFDETKTEEARLECPRCKGLLTDAHRFEMMRVGRWKSTREFRGKAGFQANALLWPHPVDPVKYPGGFLQVIAQQQLDAERSDNPERSRRVLVNTVDAETYESASDAKPEHSALFLRREDYDPREMLPAGVLCVVFFVDVQLDRLELFIYGLGENQQVWDLDYQVIKGGKGAPMVKPDEGVWAELDRILLTTTYAHPSGKVLRIEAGLVDAGNWRDHVFDFTRPRARRKIFASRGDTELSRPIVESRARKEGKHKTRVWIIGTHAAKEIIYQRLAQDNKQSTGYRHYPKLGQFSEVYFKMLLAEDSEDRQGRDGQWHKWFGCEQGVRNEALDGAVGQMAIAKILKPNFDRLARELAVNKDAATSNKSAPAVNKPAPNPAPSRSFVQRVIHRPGAGRNFVTSWKM